MNHDPKSCCCEDCYDLLMNRLGELESEVSAWKTKCQMQGKSWAPAILAERERCIQILLKH